MRSNMYFLLIIVTLVLGFGAQILVRHSYRKWKKRASSFGVSGADAARTMLNINGLHHVTIMEVPGELTDHYDPRTNVVALSREVYHGRTVSAVAIACHECGHAVQHAQNYVPAKVRGSIVPVVNIASNTWFIVLIAGIVLLNVGLVYAPVLIYVAVALFGAVLIFQLVTLPVEFNATNRAKAFVQQSGWFTQPEMRGASAVLRSAALTYVAAAIAIAAFSPWNAPPMRKGSSLCVYRRCHCPL